MQYDALQVPKKQYKWLHVLSKIVLLLESAVESVTVTEICFHNKMWYYVNVAYRLQHICFNKTEYLLFNLRNIKFSGKFWYLSHNGRGPSEWSKKVLWQFLKKVFTYLKKWITLNWRKFIILETKIMDDETELLKVL